ncbi:unnamed protein product [Sphagnum balticum]
MEKEEQEREQIELKRLESLRNKKSSVKPATKKTNEAEKEVLKQEHFQYLRRLVFEIDLELVRLLNKNDRN